MYLWSADFILCWQSVSLSQSAADSRLRRVERSGRRSSTWPVREEGSLSSMVTGHGVTVRHAELARSIKCLWNRGWRERERRSDRIKNRVGIYAGWGQAVKVHFMPDYLLRASSNYLPGSWWVALAFFAWGDILQIQIFPKYKKPIQFFPAFPASSLVLIISPDYRAFSWPLEILLSLGVFSTLGPFTLISDPCPLCALLTACCSYMHKHMGKICW